MRFVTTAGAAVLLAGSVAVVGCRSEPVTETTTPPAATAAEPRDDTTIRTAVQAKFYTEDLTRGRPIEVSAQNGAVTLSGTVPTDEARQRAVELARSVEGVTTVNGQLQVREEASAAAAAPARDDATGTAGRAGTGATAPAWITTKIQAQYFADPDIKPWAIDVTTGSGGLVTLEGTVDSAEDKAKAARIARETEGVTRVDDRLRVEATANATAQPASASGAAPAPPDVWITAKVQAKYFVDDEVKARNIDVTTQNGVVVLRGAVGSEAERRQAIALARNTDGVRDVTDQLRVDTAPGADRPARPTAEASRPTPARTQPDTPGIDRPDPWITMKIQAKYFLDADVKGRQIDVDTRDGVVTLKGTVNSAQQKQEAEQIARETEGVTRVVNQLAVGTTGGM
jgi:osmotically-inducible protein OsmY